MSYRPNIHHVLRSHRVHRAVLHGAIFSHFVHLCMMAPKVTSFEAAIPAIGLGFMILSHVVEDEEVKKEEDKDKE